MARRLRLAAIATTPLLLLGLLAWLNAVNPMAGTFADALDVVNGTDEPIEVTAIGCHNGRGRTPLPLLSTGRLTLPVLRAARSIPPRSTITITYDGDDHRASDLVVEGSRGGPRWLALEGCGAGAQPGTRSVIESVTALPEAPGDILETARAASRRGFWLFVAHFGFLVPVGLWIASRRSSRASATATEPGGAKVR